MTSIDTIDRHIKDLETARRMFQYTLGKISESEAYALLDEVSISDDALKTAIESIEAEFHPSHVLFAPTYVRPYGIEARLQVAVLRYKKEAQA